MASKADVWRRRLRRGREPSELPGDPRERLLRRVVGTPSADFRSWLEAPLSAAAVLVGLIEREAGPAVLLTERAPSRERVATLLFEEAADPLGALRWNLAQLRKTLIHEIGHLRGLSEAELHRRGLE